MRVLFTMWLMLTGIAFVHSGAADATVSESDSREIRAVIGAQLDAFAQDDAQAAFAFASPGIRRMFETAEGFLDMVQRAYPVVYRPRSVRFLPLRLIKEQPVQLVEMSDRKGVVWVAIYRLQRQPDGTWLIDGCALTHKRDGAFDAVTRTGMPAAAS